MSFDAAEQLSLPFFVNTDTASHYANVNAEERGAVFTRREVVDFILDLAGYTADRPLQEFQILEPSFGEGDFLLPIVERLLKAYLSRGSGVTGMAEDLTDAIRAVEVHPASINKTREKITELFSAHGLPPETAHRLLDQWIIAGDFLLVDLPHLFTHIAGNPPYLRQEMIPDTLMAEYRARYSTIYDRADLYVPFFERCLNSLKSKGALGFICADRWMKNKYGGPLRAMIARQYHLACYIDMVNTPAFNSEVIAYPAITIIRREKPGPTRLMRRPEIMAETLNKLARAMIAKTIPAGSGVVEISDVARSSEPWILQSLDQLAVVRRLEADFPLLEETGCKVGIGVATGADRVFIGPYEDLEVEPERKLPLVMTRDIETGSVQWKGLGVINPFNDDGTVVGLGDYPKFARYINEHRTVIKNRNCAKRSPHGWYRTIDRIYRDLTYRPKLLIPDIKGEAHIVYEAGNYYPHHNLYFIISEQWDLKALQAVLMSGIAKLFVSTYSTQMRGGYLRFQAQYLRRIRLPHWQDVPDAVRKELARAAEAGDKEACNDATFDLYRLNAEERAVIGGNGGKKENP